MTDEPKDPPNNSTARQNADLLYRLRQSTGELGLANEPPSVHKPSNDPPRPPEWEDDDFWERTGEAPDNARTVSPDVEPRAPSGGDVRSIPTDGRVEVQKRVTEDGATRSTEDGDARVVESQGGEFVSDDDFLDDGFVSTEEPDIKDVAQEATPLGGMEEPDTVEARIELRMPSMTAGGTLRVDVAEPPFELYAVAGTRARTTRSALDAVFKHLDEHPEVLAALSPPGDNNPPPSLYRTVEKRDAFYEALYAFEDPIEAQQADAETLARHAAVITKGAKEVFRWLADKLDKFVDGAMAAAGAAAIGVLIALTSTLTGEAIPLLQALQAFLAK